MNSYTPGENSKIRLIWRGLTHPLSILLLINLAVYAVFIPLLGFYWDELDFYWLFHQTGTTGLASYFALDGPVMGFLYQFHFRLLGTTPSHWHVFSFVWRWICATGIYFVVKEITRNKQEPALMVSMIFLLFPGFSQQSIGMIYGHFYIALSAFAFSVWLNLFLIKQSKARLALTFVAVLLAALNLFLTEYFFILEFLRPILLWRQFSGNKTRFRDTLKCWLPYLIVFIAAIIWRAFIFTNQTATYSFANVASITGNPAREWIAIITRILSDLRLVLFTAWGNVFSFPNPVIFGKSALWFSFAVSLVVAGLTAAAILPHKNQGQNQRTEWRCAMQWILLGLAACLLGGIPYWSTGLILGDGFPNDRFALSYIIGSGLVITGALFMLPARPVLRRSIFILFIALAGGLQVRTALTFKRDWDGLQRFLWQLSWRIPAIDPGTVVFSNELPYKSFSDLSLTAPLNLIYGNEQNAHQVNYLYLYPTARTTDPQERTLPVDQPINRNLYIGEFQGNTSRSITIYYQPPACLRIIDPQIESENLMLPLYLRETAALSESGMQLIDVTGSHTQDLAPFFTNDPGLAWCQAFEKADLARQQKEWRQVASIGDEIINGTNRPTDPMEWLVYIEGYAHIGNWQQAEALTETTLAVTKAMQPPLCRVWERIDSEIPPSNEKTSAMQWKNEYLLCSQIQ